MAPVLLAEYGVEDQKGGKGGRGGAHPVRLSELPMKILSNHLFAPAPIKRIADGGEAGFLRSKTEGPGAAGLQRISALAAFAIRQHLPSTPCLSPSSPRLR